VVNAEESDEEHGEIEEGFELVDLGRPFEGDCELKLVTFEDKEGKVVYWHSSAHVLGSSIENVFGAHLCIGPPIDPGFFYDAYYGEHTLTPDALGKIETEMKKVMKAKAPFQRAILTKEQALALFAYNPFKVQLISNKIPEGGKTTAYRCGNLIDLCTGPHVLNTGRIKAVKVTKNSSAYWLANAENDSL
jgi:threonyl-tRNA synthetase